MPTITVAVDDETYDRARAAAAERQTSVSALVTQFLMGLESREARFARLLHEERALLAEIDRSGLEFDGGDRLPRDELYRRDI